ncbi:EF-hand domain-containing protein [Sphingosinicellaceae bacterium]|nr:EF-hand domain-containing protein [Sphingosinicellaceae bacterium]
MTMMLPGTALRTIALGLLLSSVGACAQPVDQAASGPRATASAGLTLQDFIRRNEKRLLANDTDGDGKISQAEFVAGTKAGKGDPARRFAKMDANGDGMLDKSEIDAMLARRFKRLDTDGDGVASADERAAARAKQAPAADDGSTL